MRLSPEELADLRTVDDLTVTEIMLINTIDALKAEVDLLVLKARREAISSMRIDISTRLAIREPSHAAWIEPHCVVMETMKMGLSELNAAILKLEAGGKESK